MYGHIGNGNIHTRPLINVQSLQGKRVLERLAGEVFLKVKELNGSISAERVGAFSLYWRNVRCRYVLAFCSGKKDF